MIFVYRSTTQIDVMNNEAQISPEPSDAMIHSIDNLRRDLHTSTHDISVDGTERYKNVFFIAFQICACLCIILNVSSQDISGSLDGLNAKPKQPYVALQPQSTTGAETLTVLAVGDITVGNRLTPLIEINGAGIFFKGTAESIQSADIAVAFLNTSISERGEPRYGHEHTFRASLGLARALANAGFDAVSLATPHSMDFGFEALADTLTELKRYNVKPVGAGTTTTEARMPAWIPVPRVPSNIETVRRSMNQNIRNLRRTGHTSHQNKRDDGGEVLPASGDESPTEIDETHQALMGSSIQKVAVLAYYRQNEFSQHKAELLADAVYSEMMEAVTDVRDKAKLVIVLLHWGGTGRQVNPPERQRHQQAQHADALVEKSDFRNQAREQAIRRQQLFAHALIDTGADMVVCQQLHHFGGIELYQGKPIIYSLADFIYDTYSKQYAQIVIPKATYANRQLRFIELIPILTETPQKKYQPSLLHGETAIETLRDYQQRCAPFKTEVLIEKERGWIHPK